MIFTAILMFVLALLGMLLFDMKILFGVLMVLCAAGVLVNEIVLKKKIQKNYIRFIIFGVLTAAFLACAILPGSRITVKTEGINRTDDNSSINEGYEDDATDSKDDEEHLKTAREYVDKEKYQDAEMELYNVSERAKRTEEYYILSSDITTGKNGFENSVDPYFLSFLLDAVRDCPGSLILNYRAGIVAYALNRYITAESYLTRAFELAPEDDPYTPYALAAVYKELGEDEYAYAFMTIAEKNGIFNTEERDNELLVDWYRDLKDELKETEAAK
ncbi:MAG: hypothetical protein IJM37_00335 [Lachnospiraceae bacterium]|nr:hypothetical protein [Lachnospiraceae bacterium]